MKFHCCVLLANMQQSIICLFLMSFIYLFFEQKMDEVTGNCVWNLDYSILTFIYLFNMLQSYDWLTDWLSTLFSSVPITSTSD